MASLDNDESLLPRKYVKRDTKLDPISFLFLKPTFRRAWSIWQNKIVQ